MPEPIYPAALGRRVWRRVNARMQVALGAGVVLAFFVGGVVTGGRAEWLAVPVALAIALAGWAAGLAVLVRGRLRDAAEALLWTAFESRERARGEADGGFAPAGPREAALWLRRNPPQPWNAVQRVGALLMVGDLAGARREADVLPEPDLPASFGAEVARQLVALAEGRGADPARARELAAALADETERDRAVRRLLALEAMRAAADGRDPLPALAELRAVLGDRARGVFWTRYWLPMAGLLTVVSFLVWAVLAVAAPLLLS